VILRLARLVGRRPRRPSPLRLIVGALLTFWIATRPIQLSSSEWWRSPRVMSSIKLTRLQRELIEHLYRARLTGRRQGVERLVQATNRLDQLLRDEADQDEILKETQSVAVAAAEQRTFARMLDEEIVGVLSLEQREQLASVANGHVID
jgi:flagellar motor component MotA